MSFNYLRYAAKITRVDSVVADLAIRLTIAGQIFTRQGFSQAGEDRFVAQYFKNQPTGFYVEVGANNPVLLNSTYLLYRMGWKGVVVDPITRFQALFSRFRPRDRYVNAAVGSSGGTMLFHEMIPDVFSTFDAGQALTLKESGALLWRSYQVPVKSLESIFKSTSVAEIDFMSIDAEGFDHDVLLSNNWNRFRPRLICCEVDKWPNHDSFFESIGYRLLASIGCNAFYERLH